MFAVQFRNIKENDLAQFSQAGRHVLLHPDAYESGDLVYPYSAARKLT